METNQQSSSPKVKKSQSIQDFSSLIQPQLSNRSSPEYLMERNIICPDGILISSSIQAVQQKLKFQTTVNHIHHKLECRPSIETLCKCNIYRSSSKEEIQLEFKERQETLERQLNSRPSLEEIDMKHHVIPEEALLHSAEQGFVSVDSSPLDFEKNALSLSQKLEHRPPCDQLLDNNILHANSSLASNLHSPQQALKFQKTSILLEHKLEHRPCQDELIALNILKSETHATMRHTPDYLIQRESFGFQATAEHLERQLEKRPHASHLLSYNILKDIHVAPSLQATFHLLEHKKINNHLNHKLEFRPTLHLLQDQNIWRNDSFVASKVLLFKNDHRRNTLCYQLSHRPSLSDPIVMSHLLDPNENPNTLVY